MFEKIITNTALALQKYKIPYMIIGGQAVMLYGRPRLTKDIDITIGVSIDKLEDVISAVKRGGLKVIPEDVERFVKETFVLPSKDEKTGIRVDLIFSFTTYERQAIERAKKIMISGIGVKFANLEDIVIHKIFSSRPIDIEDARAILIKNPGCDIAYIKKWLSKFDKTACNKKFSNTFKDIIKGLK